MLGICQNGLLKAEQRPRDPDGVDECEQKNFLPGELG